MERVSKEIEEVVRRTKSFVEYFICFYNYLLQWGVIVNEELKLEYDHETVLAQELSLIVQTNEAIKVLDSFSKIFKAARTKSTNYLKKLQRAALRIGSLEILIRLLELIDIKVVPRDLEREVQ